MQRLLFDLGTQEPRRTLAPGAYVLPAFARPEERALVADIATITATAPFRCMVTPGGRTMSVAMTNCGAFGWISDARGYRYAPTDPKTGREWLGMPGTFSRVATAAAAAAGYGGFVPDACLVNRYEPGARMTLHRDENERDMAQPIVSVSLGLPAVFLFGGLERKDAVQRIELHHGDVVVWGGPSRLFFHGVLPVKDGVHPLVGRCRINLTFRRAR